MKNPTLSFVFAGVFLSALLCNPNFTFAQDSEPAPKKTQENEVYTRVDEMPEFPGGQQALMDYIARELKYPKEAKEKNLTGTVYVYFVVLQDGTVSDVELKRGVTDAPMLGQEAVRVVKSFPKWKPGKQNGKNVRVAFTLPVKFSLSTPQEPEKK